MTCEKRYIYKGANSFDNLRTITATVSAPQAIKDKAFRENLLTEKRMKFKTKFEGNGDKPSPSKSNVPRVRNAKVVIVMSSSEKLKWEEPEKEV